MQLRSEIQIASMITAMQTVVIPALDPANRPALEQSQLIVGFMALLSQQLPVQFQFDRVELQRLIAHAQRIEDLCGGDAPLQEIASELGQRRQLAETVLEQCRIDPAQLQASVRELREQIGLLMSTSTATVPVRESIEKQVLELSREQLLRDRSLLKPQGWEPDPDAVPAIRSLLGLTESSTGSA